MWRARCALSAAIEGVALRREVSDPILANDGEIVTTS